MPTPQDRPLPSRVRRVPRRRGFRRVVAILLVMFAMDLAWRAGAFAHPARASDRTLAAGALAPLSGPPIVTRAQTESELTKLIELGYPVACGGGTKPLVALTFDDGPGPYTKATLRILQSEGAHATFFIVAKELVDWPNLGDEPKAEARVAAIGDHTYDHVGLAGLAQAELDHQVGDAKTLIEQRSGVPVRLFRPPFGEHDASVDHEVQGLGMVEVLWSVDSGDSTGARWQTELRTVEAGLRPGAIVLMHENRGPTLKILPQLLQDIRARGLHAVTVPELLTADPPSLAQLKSGTCQ